MGEMGGFTVQSSKFKVQSSGAPIGEIGVPGRRRGGVPSFLLFV
jgi:hypothetical protein